MAKSENQKQKILLLHDFFLRETDEAHPATMAGILAYLAGRGVSAERKSVYSDIQTLQDWGMDIVNQHGKGYFLASRDFELPELKLLVDAVQSSRFLTDRKSRELIGKLERLGSRHEASLLRRQVVVAGRVKTMNESIYYNVDRIHDAIANTSQIHFYYSAWGPDGQRHRRSGLYTASPYALCWDHEYYYLIANSERHGLTHYRVDKMEKITETGKPRVQTEASKKLNLADYAKKMFDMFNGEETMVKLRFRNELSGVVIDRFGHDSMLVPDGDGHFTFTARVAVSPRFLGWVAGFGDQVQILYPERVVEEFRAMLQSVLSLYPPAD